MMFVPASLLIKLRANSLTGPEVAKIGPNRGLHLGIGRKVLSVRFVIPRIVDSLGTGM